MMINISNVPFGFGKSNVGLRLFVWWFLRKPFAGLIVGELDPVWIILVNYVLQG